MKLAATLMTVYILGGGAEPGITIVPEAVLSPDECDVQKARADGFAPVVVDPVTKRPVIMRFNKCVLGDADIELDKWTEAVKAIPEQ